MSVKMKFGSKDIPFVYKGDKLVYPNPIKDGLLLWYDFKGMRNTDTNKEVAKDLSGNGNDGTLTNFNFTEGSGYKENTLVFDGVDDKLVIPELELDETSMSVMHDGKLYAYEDDKVFTVVKHSDSEGLEVGGRNYFLNGKPNSLDHWHGTTGGIITIEDNYIKATFKEESDTPRISYNNSLVFNEITVGDWILSFDFYSSNKVDNALIVDWRGTNEFYRHNINEGWQHVTEHYSIDASNTKDIIHFFIKSFGETKIKNLKLEKGTVANDWTPAPEDFQTTPLSPSSLSNLQLYNRPLRKDELLHNTESKGLKKLKPGVIVQDGLMLHYDFSHESNVSEYKDKAFDYSGNGIHGVLNNFNFTEESGYESKGLKFDGVDDYVSMLHNKKISLARGVSAEAVVKVSEPGGVIAGRDSYFAMSTGYRFLLQCQAERYFRVRLWSEGWAENLFFYTPKGKDVAYISFTYDLNELKIYVNGELVIEQVFNHPLFDYYDELLVGRYGGGGAEYMSGEVYSSRTYNRALTPEEIAHNFAIEKEKFNITEGEV